MYTCSKILSESLLFNLLIRRYNEGEWRVLGGNERRKGETMSTMRVQYVLVHRDACVVLGPFATLELAQRFRSEHYGTLGDYSAFRMHDVKLWEEVEKKKGEKKN